MIKHNRELIAVGVILAMASAWLVLWKVPQCQVAWLKNPSLHVTADKRMELEDKTRGTLAQILGALLLAGTAYFTWQGNRNAKESQDRKIQAQDEQLRLARNAQEKQFEAQDEQLRLTREAQIAERFTKAIELLGASGSAEADVLPLRLGGIYALERIAWDSDRDHWAVMEVLTTYVRRNSPAVVEGKSKTEESMLASHDLLPFTLPMDIQAILTVLGRRNCLHTELGRLNLRGVDLRHADLQASILGAADLFASKLQNANLALAYLSGANFSLSNLDGASLQRANLDGACLRHAHLENADLKWGYLETADLGGAELKGADLRSAGLAKSVLRGSVLTSAVLSGADLRNSDLSGANLSESRLDGTNLTGADLRRVTGLTQSQLDSAVTDVTTHVDSSLVVGRGPRAN